MFTGAVCNLSTGNFRVNDLKSHLSYADDTFLSSVIHFTDTALKENKKYLYDQRVINIKEWERLKKEREEKKKKIKDNIQKDFGGY